MLAWRWIAFVLLVLVSAPGAASAAEPDSSHDEQGPPPLRLGAVAYAPSAVTIFENIRRYLNAHDLRCDYVLYSNYDALVGALERREIDIAWNTPLAHAKFYCGTEGACRTLVMRDVDRGFRSVLIARADAGIERPSDLAGHSLVLGSRDAAEATVLPLHFLRAEGCRLDQIKVVSLDEEVDLRGNPCSSERHVLQALLAGRGEAGVIGERLWNQLQKSDPAHAAQLELVWRSPEFSHCVFTSHADLDDTRAARFTELMLAMDSTDEQGAEVLRLEGAKSWVAGSGEGFEELISALKQP